MGGLILMNWEKKYEIRQLILDFGKVTYDLGADNIPFKDYSEKETKIFNEISEQIDELGKELFKGNKTTP